MKRRDRVMDEKTAANAVQEHPPLHAAINLLTLVSTIPGASIKFTNVNGNIISEFRFKKS